MSFYKDLLKYAGDEKILSMVIGEMGWSDYNVEEKPPYKHIIGKLLSIEEAKEYLDYYCSGIIGKDGMAEGIVNWRITKLLKEEGWVYKEYDEEEEI